MEKLIDGIVPSSELEEYTIVLLATPVKEQLERKNALSELYSKLAPFSTWSTTFTLSETTAVGSSATFGANLGGSAGRQIGDTTTAGTNSSRGTTASEGSAPILPITAQQTVRTALPHQAQAIALINLQVKVLTAVQVSLI